MDYEELQRQLLDALNKAQHTAANVLEWQEMADAIRVAIGVIKDVPHPSKPY